MPRLSIEPSRWRFSRRNLVELHRQLGDAVDPAFERFRRCAVVNSAAGANTGNRTMTNNVTRRSVILQNRSVDQNGATVLGPRNLVVAQRGRPLFTITDGVELRISHALCPREVLDRVGTPLTQPDVVPLREPRSSACLDDNLPSGCCSDRLRERNIDERLRMLL